MHTLRNLAQRVKFRVLKSRVLVPRRDGDNFRRSRIILRHRRPTDADMQRVGTQKDIAVNALRATTDRARSAPITSQGLCPHRLHGLPGYQGQTPIPTIRNRTPSASSASNKARSAVVRTKSNTGQTSAQPLRRGEIETPEGVVNIAGVYAGIRRRDGVRLAPHRFTPKNPGAFGLRQTLKLLAAVHEGS
jgi:hypothetical protein